MTTEESIKKTLTEQRVPERYHGSLIRYIVSGLQTGGFLKLCIANQFSAICAADDDLTIDELRSLYRWIYNEMPSEAWGSFHKVDMWVMAKEREYRAAKNIDRNGLRIS